MIIIPKIKVFFAQIQHRIVKLIGQEKIDRINQKIAVYPDHIRSHLPEWSHRFIDPVKPYVENPRFVWGFCGIVIALLITFIAYTALHEGTKHHFNPVPIVEDTDEIEAPEGGFNPDYVKHIIVQIQQVDDSILIPGRLDFNQDEIKIVSSRVQGRIEQLFVREGNPAKKGQPILSFYSPDFLAAEQEYLLATHAFNVVGGLNNRAIATDAQELAKAAKNKLQILGMDDAEAAKLSKSGTPLPLLTVKSPIDGMVIGHTFKPGAFVNLGDAMVTVAGLNTVWFRGNVYEQDVQRVKVGQRLMLQSDAYPGTDFIGEVDFVAPSLDPNVHTLEIRATLKNAGGLLKPGVYVSGVVTTGTENRVVIPKEALIREGSNAYVIQVLPGNIYKLRNVSIAPVSSNDQISIIRGLHDSDEIVNTGAVLVYESIKRKVR